MIPANGKRGVELAYSGVHEIFQMAIAAEEMGQLSRLQCSIFDAPGNWGHWASRVSYLPSAFPLGSELLPPCKIKELPIPTLVRQLVEKFKGHRVNPLPYHRWFEKQAAKSLKSCGSAIAVAAETCALHFFEAAKREGMRCVLDCHGIPNPFLDASMKRAAAEFHLPPPAPCDTAKMVEHKEQERALADVLVFCSELQKEKWIELGIPAHKSIAAPLWVDTSFWKPVAEKVGPAVPLKVLAVGCGTLAKGLPYLLQATDHCSGSVELNLVGRVAPEMQPFITKARNAPRLLPYMTREELRAAFASHHIVVLPSLGDSFGNVAMEAMACGLPVVVTDNCGVPVPNKEWRVPSHDSRALAERLQHYAESPAQLTADGETSLAFASDYTPGRYRRQIQQIYSDLLAA